MQQSSHLLLLLSTLVTCAAAGTAPDQPKSNGAAVTVTHGDASRFLDAGASPSDIAAHLADLTGHLRQLGARRLPAGQRLQIEITELDLAGHLEQPPRRLLTVRVLDGATDWPRIDVRYTLVFADGTVRQGEESLSDPTYLQRPILPSSAESLRYERRLLTQWFERRFASGPSGPGLAAPAPSADSALSSAPATSAVQSLPSSAR
jgi:hypothetical protein